MRVISVECGVSCCEGGAGGILKAIDGGFRGWVCAIIGGTEQHRGLRESGLWGTAAAASAQWR